MRGYMFRNRWLALLFVALVLSGVSRIVGTGHGDGAVDLAKRQIVEQRSQAAEAASSDGTAERPPPVAFTPDEELIDPATGFDPSPVEEGTPPAETTAGDDPPHDTLLVIRDAEAGAGAVAPAQ